MVKKFVVVETNAKRHLLLHHARKQTRGFEAILLAKQNTIMSNTAKCGNLLSGRRRKSNTGRRFVDWPCGHKSWEALAPTLYSVVKPNV